MRSDPQTPALTAARARVLEHLQQAGPVTVDEVSECLDLHVNTVRKHLDGLVDRGLATRAPAQSGGRGRPAQVYAAGATAEPDVRVRGYAALAMALADQMARTSRDLRVEALTAGEHWGGAIAAGHGPVTAPEARRRVVVALADAGFDPQPNARTTTVRLRRCPLLDAALAHPDVVCPVHLGIVRGVLAGMGADPDLATLTPFAEPGACRLDLRRPRPAPPPPPLRSRG